VREGDTMTRVAADLRLDDELVSYEQAVWSATGGNVTQGEFDAMVSLAWNIGISAFKKSTVVKAHNRGDKTAAARAFGLWNKVKGKVNKGLVRRRALEAAWYLEADNVNAFAEMPQRVDEPKAVTSSTTVIAGGTAAVATVAQIADQVSAVKYSIDGLGDWLVPVLLVVTLVAVGWVIYERFNNRDRGAI
jgi:lysozyme